MFLGTGSGYNNVTVDETHGARPPWVTLDAYILEGSATCDILRGAISCFSDDDASHGRPGTETSLTYGLFITIRIRLRYCYYHHHNYWTIIAFVVIIGVLNASLLALLLLSFCSY